MEGEGNSMGVGPTASCSVERDGKDVTDERNYPFPPPPAGTQFTGRCVGYVVCVDAEGNVKWTDYLASEERTIDG